MCGTFRRILHRLFRRAVRSVLTLLSCNGCCGHGPPDSQPVALHRLFRVASPEEDLAATEGRGEDNSRQGKRLTVQIRRDFAFPAIVRRPVRRTNIFVYYDILANESP